MVSKKMSIDTSAELERDICKINFFFPALALHKAVAAILAPQ